MPLYFQWLTFERAAGTQRSFRLERQHLQSNTNRHGAPRRRDCPTEEAARHRRRRRLRPRSVRPGTGRLTLTSLSSDPAAKLAAQPSKTAPGDFQHSPEHQLGVLGHHREVPRGRKNMSRQHQRGPRDHFRDPGARKTIDRTTFLQSRSQPRSRHPPPSCLDCVARSPLI